MNEEEKLLFCLEYLTGFNLNDIQNIKASHKTDCGQEPFAIRFRMKELRVCGMTIDLFSGHYVEQTLTTSSHYKLWHVKKDRNIESTKWKNTVFPTEKG
jgi:hypothetical protein